MAARTLTIALDDISEEDYAHLANALWMFVRATPHTFAVHVDRQASTEDLNDAWHQYWRDARWE